MADALERAVRWLRDHQSPGGWWVGELETNVTMTAEHVLLLRFLGLPLDDVRDDAIHHFLAHQREDGSWGLYYDAPADLSTTIEAYVALKVLGLDPGGDSMKRALRVIREQGGVARARVFTKMWLALFGVYPWSGVPSMPPELIHFPRNAPFNLYNFACWARGTIAPLLIVLTRKPVRPLGIEVNEIVAPGTEHLMRRVPGSGPFWWLDQLLKLYERSPVHPGRSAACARIVDWIVARQEADGSWGGIQPPWVYSLVALDLEGVPIDHPVMQRGLRGLQCDFALRDQEFGWRLQACMSPVWDSAWALLALRFAGVPRSDPAVKRAVEWLVREEIGGGGDWQVRVPGGACGGWAFEFANDVYPDVDDTAVVVLALLAGQSDGAEAGAIARSARWTLGMQSKNGAWGAFDRDNDHQIVYRLPFADFGAMLDPPSEDVTAHVVEMMARLGYPVHDPVMARALAYLRDTQQPDGSWFGRWGVNYIYGTWCAVQALAAIERRPRWIEEMMQRGAGWMVSRQNGDGGWGETCHSYVDRSFAGRGSSTASQTAWALLTLHFAGQSTLQAWQRGRAWLESRQRADGTWDEPWFTGTGFPRDFYINYHLYRHVFPTMALALAPDRSGSQDLRPIFAGDGELVSQHQQDGPGHQYRAAGGEQA